MGPIREGKFGARALSLDDSPPAIHSYGISIQTPCGLRILEQRNQNSSAPVERRDQGSGDRTAPRLNRRSPEANSDQLF